MQQPDENIFSGEVTQEFVRERYLQTLNPALEHRRQIMALMEQHLPVRMYVEDWRKGNIDWETALSQMVLVLASEVRSQRLLIDHLGSRKSSE